MFLIQSSRVSTLSLRGAITSTLYGFDDFDNEATQYFMEKIDPTGQGLTDYKSVVEKELHGIRFYLNAIPAKGDFNAGSRSTMCRDILLHFKFYETYVVSQFLSKSIIGQYTSNL